MDTAGFQLLISTEKEWKKNNWEFRVTTHSHETTKVFNLYGRKIEGGEI